MNRLRRLTILSILAICSMSFAQEKVVIGKVGQATKTIAVYESASTHSHMYYRVKAYQRLVVAHTDDPDWDRVLLKSRHWGYTPSEYIAELPYVVSTTIRQRATSLASRSGGRSVTNMYTGNRVADAAQKFAGTPYVWGGNDLYSGIDCSGFVKQVMEGTIGQYLPRTAAEQSMVGEPIYTLQELQAGDRLYFKQKSDSKISHTGIYLGNGYFIHSSHGKGGVATDYLTPSWRKILVAARR